ncbi:glycine-rich protein DOT1-like [Meles meles]|uniref:glycine-rich protein DOT1-like n=1 Tax=Meles meles TaxID=9662 RepID=UPI001E699EBB|nr:glycine-rich protein DOT1-like [Meles meles]
MRPGQSGTGGNGRQRAQALWPELSRRGTLAEKEYRARVGGRVGQREAANAGGARAGAGRGGSGRKWFRVPWPGGGSCGTSAVGGGGPARGEARGAVGRAGGGGGRAGGGGPAGGGGGDFPAG